MFIYLGSLVLYVVLGQLSTWGSCLPGQLSYWGSCRTWAVVLLGQLSTWAVVAGQLSAWAVVPLAFVGASVFQFGGYNTLFTTPHAYLS